MVPSAWLDNWIGLWSYRRDQSTGLRRILPVVLMGHAEKGIHVPEVREGRGSSLQNWDPSPAGSEHMQDQMSLLAFKAQEQITLTGWQETERTNLKCRNQRLGPPISTDKTAIRHPVLRSSGPALAIHHIDMGQQPLLHLHMALFVLVICLLS